MYNQTTVTLNFFGYASKFNYLCKIDELMISMF